MSALITSYRVIINPLIIIINPLETFAGPKFVMQNLIKIDPD